MSSASDRPANQKRSLGLRIKIVFALVTNFLLLGLLTTFLELIGCTYADKPESSLLRVWRINHSWEPNGSELHDEWVNSNPDFPEPDTHKFNRQGWIETYDVDLQKPRNVYRIF